jgi:hypothetical protein
MRFSDPTGQTGATQTRMSGQNSEFVSISRFGTETFSSCVNLT